jgi:hypothetical protein
MMDVSPPQNITDKELEAYLASLRRDAQKGVRHLLASGADEADITEYIASLGPEPENEIEPPEGEPSRRIDRVSAPLPSRQHEPPVQKKRSVAARQRGSQPATPTDRIPGPRRGKPAEESHERPAGVQGANVGYWQAGGVTRAGAKRSKRP